MQLTLRGAFPEDRLASLAHALLRRASSTAELTREEIFLTTDFQAVEVPSRDKIVFTADAIALRIEHDRLAREVHVTLDAEAGDAQAVRTLVFEHLWSVSLDEGDALLAWQSISGMESWSIGAMGASREWLESGRAQACAAIERAASVHPQHLGIAFAAGVCAARGGEPDRALAILDSIVARDDRFYAARIAAVWIEHARGHHEAVLARLDAFDPFTRHNEWHRARFESEFALARWDAALATIDAWVRLSAGAEGFALFDREADVLRASLLRRLGRTADADRARITAAELAARVEAGGTLTPRDAWLRRFM
jgi:hypothetical protein